MFGANNSLLSGGLGNPGAARNSRVVFRDFCSEEPEFLRNGSNVVLLIELLRGTRGNVFIGNRGMLDQGTREI